MSLRKSYNKSDATEVFKVLCYDTTSWVRENFEPQVEAFNKSNDFAVIKMDYTADRLDINSASYAVGYDAVCLFVNDTASADVLQILSMGGVGLIAMRCAGFGEQFFVCISMQYTDFIRSLMFSTTFVEKTVLILMQPRLLG